MIRCKLCIFWQEYHRSDAVFFSGHYIRRHMILIYPISLDLNFVHLVRMIFTRFLYHKVTIFLYKVSFVGK